MEKNLFNPTDITIIRGKVEQDVEKIIQQIMEEQDIEKEELLEKIEEKRRELSDFITPTGAATIVARSYGIIPEREEPEVRKLRIEDLSVGMSNVDIVGRTERTLEPREFERKDGSKGKVANLILLDKTGKIRAVLWDKMAQLVSGGEIQKGTPLRLVGAYVKKGRGGSPELNLGRRGEIEIDPTGERSDELPSIPDTKVKISDLDPGPGYVDVVGRVIAVTAPRKFERSDGSEGKVATLRIVDETGQTRVSLWGDKAGQSEKIDRGDAIRLENASVREGLQSAPELHLNWRGRIIRDPPSREIEDLPEFEEKLLKIEEIEADMPVLDIAAKVQSKSQPREFEREDGSGGRVMNVVLADETGTIRASFWNDMVEVGQKLTPGDVVLLKNSKSKVGLQERTEIRVGKRTNVEINPMEIEIKEAKPGLVKMSKLEEGLDSLKVAGRIIDLSEVREFTRSDGSKGRVASLTMGDRTGTAETIIWGSKTKIMDELEVGDVIKIEESYSVPGNYGRPEVHVGDQASVEIDPEIEEDLPPVSEIRKKIPEERRMKIEELKENARATIRGTVVQVFRRKPLFDICPNCGRILKGDDPETFCEKCEEIVEPDHRTVVNMIVDDGTDNVRVAAFGELGEKLLGKTADEISEALAGDAELSDIYDEIDLPGREVVLTGVIRRDEYYDQLELRARDIDFPDPRGETERILERIKE